MTQEEIFLSLLKNFTFSIAFGELVDSGRIIINDANEVEADCSITLRPTFRGTRLPVKFSKVTRFSVSQNRYIRSLSGCPREVNVFDCSHTGIRSLRGCPQIVHKSFFCYDTPITTLAGAPASVGGSFTCIDTAISSLEGCPASGHNLYCPANIGLLSLCTLNFRYLELEDDDARPPVKLRILASRYLGSGPKSVLPFATELVTNGFIRQASFD